MICLFIFWYLPKNEPKKQAKGDPLDPRLPNALEEERSGQMFGLTETPLGQIRRPKGCLYFEFVGGGTGNFNFIINFQLSVRRVFEVIP